MLRCFNYLWWALIAFSLSWFTLIASLNIFRCMQCHGVWYDIEYTQITILCGILGFFAWVFLYKLPLALPPSSRCAAIANIISPPSPPAAKHHRCHMRRSAGIFLAPRIDRILLKRQQVVILWYPSLPENWLINMFPVKDVQQPAT